MTSGVCCIVVVGLLCVCMIDASSSSSPYEPKPEIQHVFREAEKRPPTIVSDVFTGLIVGTFVLLLILWAKIGVNVSNMPFSLATLGFHAGLLSIFGLFFVSWIKLDMFQTLKCLSGVAVLTFLSGHSLLKDLSAKRTTLTQ